MQQTRTERDALLAWSQVRRRLSALATAGTRAREAVEAGDALSVRTHVHAMRSIRAALARDQAEAPELPKSPAGVEFLSKLRPIRARATEATQIAKIWLERQVPEEDILKQSVAGYLTLAERLLPSVWDVDVDLAVLVGPNTAAMAHALASFGQQRILLFVPTGLEAPTGELPPQAVIIRNRSELDELGSMLSTQLPERMVAWRGGPEVTPARFTEANDEIREALAVATIDRNTLEAFGDLWLRQGLANVPAIASRPVLAGAGQFENVPMVIVAPGPSLAKNIQLLREVKGKALIATFSHTLGALEEAGVVPDLVLAADMEDLRYHFEGYPLEHVEALALAYTVHPDLYSLPARRTFSFSSNRTDSWLSELLDDDTHVPNGGSVAHMAFSMGLALGCNPITLVGQDLSFPSGRVYCAQSVDGEARAEVADDGATMVIKDYSSGYARMQSVNGARQSTPSRVVTVPGPDGKPLPTTMVFSMFRQWFITQAQRLRREGSGPTLLNCTEGGAYIEGLEHLPLREAIDRFMTEPVDIPARFDALNDTDISAKRNATLERLHTARDAVRHCQVTAKRGVSLIKKLERGRGSIERLGEAEKALSAAIAPVRFLSLMAQAEIAAINREGRRAESLQDNLASTRRLFRAVQKAADTIAPKLKHAITQLERGTRGKRCA